MSRFKTYALFTAFLAGILGNKKMSQETKEKEAATLNRNSGGILFGGSHIPGRLPNQRQRRKRAAQTR
jgi:hypothetical protein